MKSLTLSLLASFAISLSVIQAQTEEEPFPPAPIPEDRYDAMMQRSPFVLPTAEEQRQEVTTTWASDFQIVSVLKVGGESVVLARKVSTDQRVPMRSQANALGIRLVKLQMSSDPRQVSAVLEMEGIEGTIQYAPEILSGLPTSVASDNPALKSE